MAANDNDKEFMDAFMPAMRDVTGLKCFKDYFDFEQRVDAAHRMAKQAQENGKKSRKKLPQSKKNLKS